MGACELSKRGTTLRSAALTAVEKDLACSIGTTLPAVTPTLVPTTTGTTLRNLSFKVRLLKAWARLRLEQW